MSDVILCTTPRCGAWSKYLSSIPQSQGNVQSNTSRRKVLLVWCKTLPHSWEGLPWSHASQANFLFNSISIYSHTRPTVICRGSLLWGGLGVMMTVLRAREARLQNLEAERWWWEPTGRCTAAWRSWTMRPRPGPRGLGWSPTTHNIRWGYSWGLCYERWMPESLFDDDTYCLKKLWADT